ncbi:MAG: hypothetical protein ACYC4I_03055 [Minisyncoccota bacterium]
MKDIPGDTGILNRSRSMSTIDATKIEITRSLVMSVTHPEKYSPAATAAWMATTLALSISAFLIIGLIPFSSFLLGFW